MKESISDKEPVSWQDYALLAGCIAYFVCPADFIPDWVPMAGYSDDLAALTMGFKKLHKIFSQSAKDSAISKASEIFGKNFDPGLAAKVVSGAIETKRNKK